MKAKKKPFMGVKEFWAAITSKGGRISLDRAFAPTERIALGILEKRYPKAAKVHIRKHAGFHPHGKWS